MSNGNADPNVNSGLQMSEEDKKFFDSLKAEKAAEQARKEKEEKRKLFHSEIKKSAGDGYEVLAAVKNTEGKTIEDLFKEQPQLLDDPSLAKGALELFKSIAKSQSAGASESAQRGADPLRPAGNGAGGDGGTYSVPEFNSPEWFADFAAGKITKEAIMASDKFDNDAKFNLIRSIPKKPVTVPASEAISKMM